MRLRLALPLLPHLLQLCLAFDEIYQRWEPADLAENPCTDDAFFFGYGYFQSQGQSTTCRSSLADQSYLENVANLTQCAALCASGISDSPCPAFDFRSGGPASTCEIYVQRPEDTGTAEVGSSCWTRESWSCSDWKDETWDCSEGTPGFTQEEIHDLQTQCPASCNTQPPLCQGAITSVDVGYMVFQGLDGIGTQYDLNIAFTLQQVSRTEGLSVPLTAFGIAIGTDPTEVVQRTEYMLHGKNRNVSVIIGPFLDDLVQASVGRALVAGKLFVAPVSGNRDIFERSPIAFSFSRPYNKILSSAFDAIVRHAGRLSVGAIGHGERHAPERFGARQILLQVAETAKVSTLVPINNAILEVQEDELEDMSQIVLELITPRPDVIVCLLGTLHCVKCVEWIREYGGEPHAIIFLEDQFSAKYMNSMLAGLDVHDQVQLPNREAELLRDVLFVSEWDRTITVEDGLVPGDPTAAEFIEHMLKTWHAQPTMEGAAAAAATLTLLRLILSTQSTKAEVLAAALRNLDAKLFYGQVKFDQHGMLDTEAALYQLNVERREVQTQAAGSSGLEKLGKPVSDSEQSLLNITLRSIAPSTGSNVKPLKLPRTTWKMANCLNTALLPIGLATYGMKLEYLECDKCHAGELSIWNESMQSLVCDACPPGKYLDVDDCGNCPPGKFTQLPGQISCSSCPRGTHAYNAGSTDCSICPAGKFASDYGGSKICRPCTALFQESDPHAIRHWSGPGAETCDACPEGGMCLVDRDGVYTNYTNAEGYYLFEEDFGRQDKQFGLYQCTHGSGKACAAGGSCYRDETGEEAMQGPMCGSCRHGFAKKHGDPNALCRRCPSLQRSTMACVWQCSFFCAGIVIFLVINAITDYRSPTEPFWIVMRQFINYLHMAAVVLSANGEHGLYFVDVSGTYTMFAGVSTANYSPESFDCLVDYLLPDMPLYKVLVLQGLLTLPAIAVASFPVFLLAKLVTKALTRNRWRPSARTWSTWMLLCVYLYLPRAHDLLMTTFRCQTYDIHRLLLQTEFDCNGPEIQTWQAISIVGVVLMSVGTPLSIYLLLRKLQRQDKLYEEKAMRTYGFLYVGFEPPFYYFECIFMIRKLVFSTVTYLPGMTTHTEDLRGLIQNTLFIMVGILSMQVHLSYLPFDNRANIQLDILEWASLRAVLATALSQLFCLTTNRSQLFMNDGPKTLRTWLISVFIAYLHLRVCVLAFWICIRGYASTLAARAGKSKLLGFVCLDPGCVLKLIPEGLIMKGRSDWQWFLMGQMFQELTELHLRSRSKLGFDEFAASLQKMCVHSLYRRRQVEAKFAAFLACWVQRITRIMGKQNRLAQKIIGWLVQLSPRKEGPDLVTFEVLGPESIAHARGQDFTVEELHAAMMSLGSTVCQQMRVGYPEEVQYASADEELARKLRLENMQLHNDIQQVVHRLQQKKKLTRQKGVEGNGLQKDLPFNVHKAPGQDEEAKGKQPSDVDVVVQVHEAEKEFPQPPAPPPDVPPPSKAAVEIVEDEETQGARQELKQLEAKLVVHEEFARSEQRILDEEVNAAKTKAMEAQAQVQLMQDMLAGLRERLKSIHHRRTELEVQQAAPQAKGQDPRH
eukprot:TRINITY_DN32803_c0_g1_i1.p1 TRINITY_DN32803_c0_g1~~TRINITY_DN32803_c0_g1_i1.p1  ORF type:complete len:1593 (+),score=256.10 TRINITY_DN32803_c0_g1_i1:138-4916(+)